MTSPPPQTAPSGTTSQGWDRRRLNFEPADVDFEGNQAVLLGRLRHPACDAAHRLRVSSSQSLLSAVHTYNTSPLLFEKMVRGSPATATTTHVPDKSAVRLSLSNEPNAAVVYQGPYQLYQAGTSVLVRKSFNFEGAKAGVAKREGLFDDSNGIFFEQDGSALNWVVRSKVSGAVADSRVAQQHWNLDRLDGTGRSRVAIDASKAQFLVFDFTWFSLGVVSCGFEVAGEVVYCHAFYTSNEQDGPYMTTAHLPPRSEIHNTGTPAPGTSTFLSICSSVDAEGWHSPPSYPFGTANQAKRAVGVGARLPVLAIRPGAQFNSVTFRGHLQPFEPIVMSDQDIHYELVVGGTIAGGTWTAADASSAAQVNTGGTSIAGGRVVRRGIASGSIGNSSLANGKAESIGTILRVAADGLDTTTFGTLAIVASAYAQPALVAASICWNEVY